MSILIECPNGDQLRVLAEHAGAKARCPTCGVVFIVPEPADGATPQTPEPAVVATVRRMPPRRDKSGPDAEYQDDTADERDGKRVRKLRKKQAYKLVNYGLLLHQIAGVGMYSGLAVAIGLLLALGCLGMILLPILALVWYALFVYLVLRYLILLHNLRETLADRR